MKKKLAIILMCCVIFCLVGCNKPDNGDDEINPFLNVKSDSIMFEVHKSYNALADINSDYHAGDKYTIYYDGRVTKEEIMNISDNIKYSATISKSDLQKLQDIGEQNKNNSTTSDYNGCDAPSYDITYYDTLQNKYELTSFSDNLKDYDAIIDVINSCSFTQE